MFRRACVLLICAVCSSAAGATPLTVEEISLMLRSGYSSDAVVRELQTRHFVGDVDQMTEKRLSKAGASGALLEALRSGTFKVSGPELIAAKEKLAAQARAAANAKKSVELMQPGSTISAASNPPIQQQAGGGMYDHLKDDLVIWHEGSLVPLDNETFQQKKYYVLFFSAVWSKEGRQFTLQLVDYYNRISPQHPEFEIVFFSADRSEFAMQNYISQTNMPWPAVAYDKLRGKAGALSSAFTDQIPRLILVDASGKVLSDSGQGQPDFGKVLTDLNNTLTGARR